MGVLRPPHYLQQDKLSYTSSRDSRSLELWRYFKKAKSEVKRRLRAGCGDVFVIPPIRMVRVQGLVYFVIYCNLQNYPPQDDNADTSRKEYESTLCLEVRGPWMIESHSMDDLPLCCPCSR